jgi:hypothetical protein
LNESENADTLPALFISLEKMPCPFEILAEALVLMQRVNKQAVFSK